MREYIDAPGRAMVDVRSPAEYTGQVIAPPGMSETAQRGGHIPSATNVPWAQAANEDGSFKSAEELHALYGGKGVTSDKDVVAYCASVSGQATRGSCCANSSATQTCATMMAPGLNGAT